MKKMFPCDPPSGRQGPRKAGIAPSQTMIRKKSCLKKIGKIVFRCLNSGEKFS